jgi:hypothetical protein
VASTYQFLLTVILADLNLISTHDLEWDLGCLGCEMISSHLESRGVLARSRLDLANSITSKNWSHDQDQCHACTGRFLS